MISCHYISIHKLFKHAKIYAYMHKYIHRYVYKQTWLGIFPWFSCLILFNGQPEKEIKLWTKSNNVDISCII